MRYFNLFISMFISSFLYAQNEECGFVEHTCDTLSKSSIAYSFDISGFIISGKVLGIDTIAIAEIINSKSILKTKTDTLQKAQCAKNVLATKKIIKVQLEINEVFKGDFTNEKINIITPLEDESTGYSEFNLNKGYLVYGSLNETADIYFFWTFDADYLYLKPEYIYWTNKCNRTRLFEIEEINQLRILKQ